MATAARMTPPLMTCCQKGDTFSRTRPLFSTPMIRQPSTVPQTRAAAAGERRAADDDGGDGVELVAEAGVGCAPSRAAT